MASHVVVPFPREHRARATRGEVRARTLGKPDPTLADRRRGFVRSRLETLRGVLVAVYDVLSYVHEPRLAPQRPPARLPAWSGDVTRR